MKSGTRFDRIVLSAIILLFAFGLLAKVSVNEKKTSATKETTSTRATTTTKPKAATSTTETTVSEKTAPFATVAFTVTAGGKTTDEKCALLARSQVAQETGMAGKTDLGGYDAMIFQFEEDTKVAFWGRGVVVPLYIFWYSANGQYIDQNSIEPCPATATNCPQVASGDVAFRYAVEVPKGGLGGTNLREGSTLTLGGGCSR